MSADRFSVGEFTIQQRRLDNGASVVKFTSWSGLDEASGRPDDGDYLSGRLVAHLERQAVERGHEQTDDDHREVWLAVNGPAPRGAHLAVPEDEQTWFHVQLVDAEGDLIIWQVMEAHQNVVWNRRYGLGVLDSEFDTFLTCVETESLGGSGPATVSDVGKAIEQFVYRWRALSGEIAWPPSEQRVADALISMLTEVGKVETPPRSIIRSAIDWFGPRVDLFTNEFTKAAGKTAGVGAVAGAAYVATHIPYLREALTEITGWLDHS